MQLKCTRTGRFVELTTGREYSAKIVNFLEEHGQTDSTEVLYTLATLKKGTLFARLVSACSFYARYGIHPSTLGPFPKSSFALSSSLQVTWSSDRSLLTSASSWLKGGELPPTTCHDAPPADPARGVVAIEPTWALSRLICWHSSRYVLTLPSNIGHAPCLAIVPRALEAMCPVLSCA